MFNNLLNKPLKLTKTHDFCPSGKPRLTAVFLHGIASESSTFKSAIDYLEGTTSLRDVRFVTFDLLGSGKSLKSDKLNYDFKEQLEALDNAISDLKLDTPMVLVGHSMGCLISSRYTDLHKRKVKELILISPPIYRPEDFKNPAFMMGQDGFKKVVFQKNPSLKTDKAFNNEMEKIVLNTKNYEIYTRLTRPTTIIFGLADQIIASFNIPGLLRKNSKIVAIETPGAHGISRDKYIKMLPIFEKVLNEVI
ncbi:alpha/beta hydrolase [Candidatus Saccharibacteria bacterium]|nr:alpha/beta hydrolase [Candidatus Saccharibacteria bacterium]